MVLSVRNTIYSLLLIVITTFLFNKYYTYIVNHQAYTISVFSTHEAEGTMELYFDIGNGFNENDKIATTVVKGENESIFHFENESLFKKFRLDFGDRPRGEEIHIKSVKLETENKEIFFLTDSEILRNIEIYSSNVRVVNKNLKIFENDKIFDPYIGFKTLNRIIIPDWSYILIIFLPIFLVNLRLIYRNLRSVVKNKEFDLLFVILFLSSIPLKDALTTFSVLLWIGYVLIVLFKNRVVKIGLSTLIFSILFLIPLLFGKVTSYDQINILLSFFLFVIISLRAINTYSEKIRDYYPFIINVIALVILGSWLNYMLYYADYDNITFAKYFEDIKYTNEHIREWMGFAHPAYTSTFSIIAVLFSIGSYKRKKIRLQYFLVTLFISLTLTLILGSRVALLLLGIILMISILSIKHYNRFLLALFSIFGIVVFTTINVIDPIRYQLWSISVHAIKQKPLLGYGLGSSEDLISNKELNISSGFNTILDFNHPHNQYISYILEIGMIGFVCLIGMLLLVHFFYKNRINKIYATILFIWGILSFVESPFETSKPTFLLCFFLLVTCGSSISKGSIKELKI